MTKQEYLKGITPHEEWLKSHNKYIDETIKEMKDYFDVDRFIEDNMELASAVVILNILADAFNNNNYQLGELEDDIARFFSLPYENVVEYRTEKFWEEIKED